MDEDPLDSENVEKLLLVKKIFSFISLMVLFLILLLFWFLKKIKKKIIYLNILYLILIEMCYLISMVLPYQYNEPDTKLCFAETLLINFFLHCKLIWCFLMGYTSIMESLFYKSFQNHFISFSFIILSLLILIPFLSSTFLFLNKLSGNYGVYCYLPLNNTEMRYYVTKIHIYFTAIKVFFIIISFYSVFRSKRNKKALKKITKFTSNHKYLQYPKLICSFQTLDLIPNIYKIITINSTTFFIELIHIILNCSEGIFIFIIFLKSPLFQILFAQFYKNIKKKKGKKKRIKKNKKLQTINSIINDSNNNSPLIDEREADEN